MNRDLLINPMDVVLFVSFALCLCYRFGRHDDADDADDDNVVMVVMVVAEELIK